MTMFSRAWLMSLSILLAFQPIAVAQYDLEDDLRRADKQFELYAYNLALQSYLAVYEKAPNNAYALTRIGDCYFQLNRPADALTWYDRATNTKNAQPEVLLNYGKALMATGNYPAAKKWFLFYSQNDATVGKHFAEMCEYATFNAGKEALYIAHAEPMNSSASDFGPAFLGKKIVFNSARTDLAKRSKGSSDWAGTAYNQLLVTQPDAKNTLQKPSYFKSDLANVFNEGPVSFSADGKRVAFCKNNFVDGTRQIANSGLNMNIFLADVQENGEWTNVKAFSFNASEYSNGYPYLSADGKTLYFASNKPDGQGGWDLYLSQWNGKSWSKPQNLGAQVNTPGNEITPFVAGNNLYFSSDWHLGFGGMDVFRAEKLGDSWEKVFHLGPGINSPRDDYGFIFNEENHTGYLTSNRSEGKGNEDIWRIQRRTENFEIIVLDAQKQPLDGANIDFSACGGKTAITGKDGKASFSNVFGKTDCEATVKKEGFKLGEIELKSGGNSSITLILESDGLGRFVGQVLDYQTKSPLADVQVRALPMPKGDVVSATTNSNGSYTLVLESKKNYKISYSKEGFADAMITLETGNAKSSNEVSAIYLQNQIAANLTADANKTPAPTKTPPVPTTYSTETPKSNSKSNTTPATSTSKSIPSPVLEELKVPVPKNINGFAVQIASLPGVVSADKLARYNKMKAFGNIYTRSASNVTKVRVGVFATREEAIAVQKRALAENFNGSFVLEEKNVEETLLFSPSKKQPTVSAEKPKPADASNPDLFSIPAKPAPSLTKTDNPTAGNDLQKKPVRYAVQLSSIPNDQTVNLAPYMKITDLGNIYTRSDNDMTKIRLGVWENADDAKKAQESVVKRGFKEAVVVLETSTASTDKFLIKNYASSATSSTQTPPANSPKNSGQTPKGGGNVPVSAPKISTPTTHSTPTSNPQTTPAPVVSPYKIRVATFENPDNFDKNSIRAVRGNLEYFKEGKKTVILLAGYPDLTTCEDARTLVQKLGYTDAVVVQEDAGKLRRVKN